jgi:class 3 adenylate cyclase
MTRLPSGIIVFFMTDVEASTLQWQDNPARMDRDLAILDTEICDTVSRHGGVVITARGEGDSHFAVFERASAAVQAAVELQRARATSRRPSVRLAVHAGEADCRAGNYYGTTVNVAARIRSAAHGGQILVSRVVADLAGRVEGLSFRGLGAHRLRDLACPVELYQVCAAGIPAEFPAPITADNAASPLMAVVLVDQHNGSVRIESEGLVSWFEPLVKAFRAAAERHDGRFVKVVGDGCFAAFDDPRRAIAFAGDLCGMSELNLRAAVGAGLVEVVEGELVSAVLPQIASQVQRVDPGSLWVAPIVAELLAGHDHAARA